MAAVFCGDFFCSSFFCVATSDVTTAIETTGGGGQQTYVIARPSLRRRRIPRFTRVIYAYISHQYWISQKIQFDLPKLYGIPITTTIPKTYDVQTTLKARIQYDTYLYKGKLLEDIKSKPHPEIIKKLKKLMGKMKEWQ